MNESEAVGKASGDKVVKIVKELSMVKEVSTVNESQHS